MRAARILTILAGTLMGCSALIGVKDIYLDPSDGGGADGSSSGSSGTSGSSGASGTSGTSGTSGSSGASGTSGTSGASGSSGGEGGSCPGIDTKTDAANCGRCGHDCQGGTCTASKCDPVTLAALQKEPNGIALDGTNVYFTTGGGSVSLVPKAGGTLKALATGQTGAQGVQINGTKLYWSNGDYPFDDAGAKGGIWTCDLPACAAPKLLAPGDNPINVQLANGTQYFAGSNDSTIRVVLADGGAGILATTNRPFGLGVDTAYAYYTSSQPNLYRAPLDGGPAEAVGPGIVNSGIIGYVTLDGTRFYWALTDGTAHHVFGALKSDPGSLIDYARNDGGVTIQPVGVAVDATNIYWTTDGTYSGPAPVGDGKVLTCPIAGCGAGGAVVVADGLTGGGPLVMDGSALYWCEFGQRGAGTGRVRKVAKP